jgi:O-acetyl-ADP-ribose deacetylase (regulator of RNase III)
METKMEIVVQLADALSIDADALAYAGTTEGTMDDAVGERLLELVGEELLEETLSTAPIAVGAATVNEVSGLKAECVIYSPVRVESGDRITVENARRCTRAALVAFCAKDLETLVLSAITPSTDDMSLAEAARAMIDELRGFRSDHEFTVYLVHEDPEVINALNRVFDSVR